MQWMNKYRIKCALEQTFIFYINILVYNVYNIYIRCIDTLENSHCNLRHFASGSSLCCWSLNWMHPPATDWRWCSFCSITTTDWTLNPPSVVSPSSGTAASSPLIPSSYFIWYQLHYLFLQQWGILIHCLFQNASIDDNEVFHTAWILKQSTCFKFWYCIYIWSTSYTNMQWININIESDVPSSKH